VRNTLFAVLVLGLAATATSVLVGCGAPNRSGGASSTGGSQALGGSGGDLGGTGSGGSASSGGAIGQGGSAGNSSPGAGGNSSPGAGGSSSSGGSSGGDTGTSAKGGSSGSGGANLGGTTAKGGSGGAGGSSGSSGGGTGGNITTASGGTTAKGGGGAGNGGSSGSGGTVGTGGSGGTTGTGGTIGSGGTTGAGGTAGSSGTGPAGPCDIYQSAGTPCGAAHSTVRALYGAYRGPLYQVQRASDKTTKDIPVASGGFVDVSVQDSFCSGTTCTIPIIYDQSPNGNHLRVTWWAYWLQTGGNPADASAGKITVGGHSAHGIYVTGFGPNIAYRTGTQLSGTAAVTKGSSTVTFSSPQTLPANTPLMFVVNTQDCPADSWPNNCLVRTYFTAADISASTTVTLKTAYNGTASSATVAWNQGTKGLATGDQPEAMYMVLDGTRSNNYCCFDYGNAELSGWDEGNATMEALYWGASTQFGSHGSGSGPWVLADLENGMFAGDSASESTVVSGNTSITGMSFVTGMLRGPSGNTMGLKAGNAQSGTLQTKWNGARPAGYSPTKKQGAIILGTGGDGSQGGTGTFFEGAITNGLPSDATDDAVQANIVAAGYGR
jgi:hypothetical protein